MDNKKQQQQQQKKLTSVKYMEIKAPKNKPVLHVYSQSWFHNSAPLEICYCTMFVININILWEVLRDDCTLN